MNLSLHIACIKKWSRDIGLGLFGYLMIYFTINWIQNGYETIITLPLNMTIFLSVILGAYIKIYDELGEGIFPLFKKKKK